MGLMLLAALFAQDAAIDGRWANPDGSVILAIAPCGKVRCGTVQWASDQAKDDARRSTEQLVGSDLLTGLEERKAGQWSGRLFIPDQKLRVKARLQLVGERQLKVTGCAFAIICKSQVWSRFDQPLPE